MKFSVPTLIIHLEISNVKLSKFVPQKIVFLFAKQKSTNLGEIDLLFKSEVGIFCFLKLFKSPLFRPLGPPL